MGRVFQPLLFLLARCTLNDLIRQVEWLKVENEMLLKRFDKKRIFFDEAVEARLMKLGQVIFDIATAARYSNFCQAMFS